MTILFAICVSITFALLLSHYWTATRSAWKHRPWFGTLGWALLVFSVYARGLWDGRASAEPISPAALQQCRDVKAMTLALATGIERLAQANAGLWRLDTTLRAMTGPPMRLRRVSR